jgi:BNR repeat-like domain
MLHARKEDEMSLCQLPKRLISVTVLAVVLSSFAPGGGAWGFDLPLLKLQHVKVYAEPGRFGGWPANHGVWNWGDEILVGFSAGFHKDLGNDRHNIDREKPEHHFLARSMDGGLTWTIENPAEKGALIPVGKSLHGITPSGQQEKPWTDCPGEINFAHPDFAMTVRMIDHHVGPSRFYYSMNRGHDWNGPFRLPDVGTVGISARTDYIVSSKDECTLFVTSAKSDQREGRPLCMRTEDGGKSWLFVGWIGDEPKGYAIMPTTVRIRERELLSAIRCREGPRSWIDAYRSLDNGATWLIDSTPVQDAGEGNPASMIRTVDGRICITYGYRKEPFGIRARLSNDAGKTWQPEMHLRQNGGGRDIGYPRTVQRTDGKMVTIYYFHDSPKGERYIAATIWELPKHE